MTIERKRNRDDRSVVIHSPSVQLPDGVCGIARVLELHESKAGRIPGHPHAPQGSVITERSLQLRFIAIVAQITHVHLTVQRTITMHDSIYKTRELTVKHVHAHFHRCQMRHDCISQKEFNTKKGGVQVQPDGLGESYCKWTDTMKLSKPHLHTPWHLNPHE